LIFIVAAHRPGGILDSGPVVYFPISNAIFARHAVEPADSPAAQIRAFDDTWHWTPDTEQHYDDAIAGGVPGKVADALAAFRMLLGENDAMAYLVNMAPRLVELHRVLKSTGSLYLHCDPTMSHYLKILLDAIFGVKNFINEISWHYNTGGASKKTFSRKHDIILFYAKSDESRIFFPQHEPFREDKTDHFNFTDEDGRKYRIRTINNKDYKYYLDEGRICHDVWEIDALNAYATERLGYPTQKPVALLERVIQASSEEGGVVLDPFCGCGTTVDAAIRTKRRWIGIDITYIAVDLINKRLRHTYGESILKQYDIVGIPADLEGAKALFGRSPFDFERWAVSLINAQPNEKQVGDKGVDGVGRFLVDTKSKVGRMLVSVKGGKTVGPQAVRDLIGTVDTQKAEMGVLLLMGEPTRGVLDAVAHAGSYTWPINGQRFPRVQVLSVAQLIDGQRPQTPSLLLPYIQAARAVPPPAEQFTLEI